ncbi:hypothetical protein [Aureispira anguillae]|uniref:Uncharacterized protein n=1 Tax=Aureispira anguillae TaxID=2864201 RepID=A0A915YGX9_9BACT|nr:hypothetical protein [Aureispira anguillae]BDS12814.1 hypothetical protein AsAng_0035390 [Aureispira anguillae]
MDTNNPNTDKDGNKRYSLFVWVGGALLIIGLIGLLLFGGLFLYLVFNFEKV